MNKFIATITLALGLTAGLPALADNAAADAHAVPAVAAKDFIASGKSYFVDFGHQKFRLDFPSPEKLRFTSPDGKNSDEVAITTTKVGDGVYMIYWTRRAKQHVVHVDDFKNGVAHQYRDARWFHHAQQRDAGRDTLMQHKKAA